jgi:hypothetical protein
MRREHEDPEPFPTQEALDRIATLHEKLDRAVTEMRDLRSQFIALAEREVASMRAPDTDDRPPPSRARDRGHPPHQK